MAHDSWTGSITLNLGELRTMIFTHAEELVAELAAKKQTIKDADGNIVFLPADSPGLKVYKTLDERYKKVEADLIGLDPDFTETIKRVLQTTKDESKTGKELYQAYLELPTYSRESQAPHLNFIVEADNQVTLNYSNTIAESAAKPIVNKDKSTYEFLNSVSELLSEARNSNKELTADQAIAVRTAYSLIERGHPLPRPYTSLGAPGTRKHQTLLFVTDAGPDNIKITTKSKSLLDGVTVHTEYIDRSESKDKSLVEAYRLPSHIDAGKVRLHVGTDAPCSCYIGRPVFEGLNYKGSFEEYARIYREKNQEIEIKPADFFFKANLLKTAHFWASACSAMFANGIVDCKIAIERMSELQAIEFMKAVRANVIRDPETQFLSAAFNLFTEIENAKGEIIKKPLDIAKLAIKIAKEGGFDKVTWDGAGTQVPSIPITKTLPFEDLLELVHLAHEQGLITYISAGLTVNDLAGPVYAGVDGCGIGNDLHYLTTGQAVVKVGAFNPKKIQDVIDARNVAEAHVLGQGGKLLAKLDIKYFEGSLETDENDLRQDLYQALLRKDEGEVQRLINQVSGIENQLSPVKGKLKYNRAFLTAHRLLRAKKPILHDIVASHKDKLQRLLDQEDAVGIRATIENIKAERQQVANLRLPKIRATPKSVRQPRRRVQARSFAANANLAEEVSHEKVKQSPLNAGVNKIAANRTKVFTNGGNFLRTLRQKSDKQSFRSGPLFKRNVCLVNLDLSAEDKGCLCDKDLRGVYVIGRIDLPEGLTEDQLIEQGAVIIKPKLDLPFDPTRADLYDVDELQHNDTEIYEWVHKRMGDGKDLTTTVQERVMIDLHDSQILASLRKYVANHHVVGIMGGHAMLRGDPMFKQIALLCRQLAKLGFMVVTGGGPGAMEAANLGAYFSIYEESELSNAIAMLQVNNLPPGKKEYENYMVADEVLQKYRNPEAGKYSLGVPTFFYGHEPYNRFALRQAKFVSNAIREDILVNICNCGIIFTPGAAGTRTEIFQFAVPNAYATEEPKSFSKPMIFLGVYWLENGVFQSVANVAQKEDAAKNRPTGYSTKMYCVKESDQVLTIINDFKKTYYEADQFPIPTVKPADKEEAPKRLVAQAAVNKYVTRSEMKIGVGSGTTVKYVIEHLSTLAKVNNWHLTTVPASLATRDALVATKNLVVSSLLETPFVDVVFDGTDETDAVLNQIKGGGGALMQEKILAAGTNQFIIIADSRKESEYLGKRPGVPIPIEVNTLAYKRVKAAIVRQYGIEVKLRKTGESHLGPYMTDNSNVILDAFFSREQLANPNRLEVWIRKIPGVLDIGLFTGMVARAFFTSPDGSSVHERTRLFDLRDSDPTRTGITAKRQYSVLQKVLKAVENTPNAVVEMDLDLAALSPYERTIRGVQKAGEDYGIPEFADPQRYFKELPGYTIDAWNAWITSEELKEVVSRNPDLPWAGKDKKYEFAPFSDEHATVWSSFHIRYWESGELVAHDVPTAGLARFEELIHEAGGKLVFLSGRWTEDQIKGTKVCLKKSGIPHERIHLLIGNPDKKFSDAENKIRFQTQVVATYGTPVAFFDDRKSNLDALKKQIPSLITVAMAIPGYSSATDVSTAENAVATFELEEGKVPESQTSSLFEFVRLHANTNTFAKAKKSKAKPVAISAAEQLLAAPTPKAIEDGVSTIRVGTFNVENLFSRFQFKKSSKPDFGNQDLKRSLTEDAAKRITAQAVRKLNADVLAMQEVEDIQTLNFFVDQYLADQGYEHRYLIEGNDTRGIDVAVISRFPITHLRSYRNDKTETGQVVFSRDCLEVTVQQPSSQKEFMLYINHFKSMAGGREQTSPKRRAQCQRVIEILKANHGPNLDQGKPFIVLGDFNDYVDDENNSGIWPLVKEQGLLNPVDFLPELERWTHYYAAENDYHQLDFLLLSKTLQRGSQQPIVVRAGQPLRATRVEEPRFAGVGRDRPKASDHCPMAYDIVL